MNQPKYLGDMKKLEECMNEALTFGRAGYKEGIDAYRHIREAFNILVQCTTPKQCLFCENPHYRDSRFYD